MTAYDDADQFRQMVDSLPHLVFTADANGLCDFVNVCCEEYTGVPRAALLGLGWTETIHPDDREGALTLWKSAIASSDSAPRRECRIRGKDGAYRWFDVRARFIRDSNGEISKWVGSLMDIDDAHRTLEALNLNTLKTSDRARTLAQFTESIREVVWVTNPDKKEIVYISPAYETIWGRKCEALYASPIDWLDAVHPEDRDRVIAKLPSQSEGAYDEEYRIVRPDGEIRWIRDRAHPVRDETGTIIRIGGLAEDITERRELELQLRATQKMESIGRLAGGVAHDFNNLLTIIIACTDEILDSVSLQDPIREPLGETRLATQRATSLTRDLLAFSRRQIQEPEIVDLNEVVMETDRMLRRLLGEDILLLNDLAPNIGNVKIDRGQWTSVLVNLAINARHAMPRGGKLIIKTGERVDEETTDRYAVLEMTDSGCGFGPEVKARIFEPFFTTKGAGKGTGLGLAVVHGVVQQSGGHIEVTSTEGAGTTFRIEIPMLEAGRNSETRRSSSRAPLLAGTETVLFVEDESAVRRTTTRALEARGFRVLAAADAEEALRLLAEHASINIIVTDVVLPKMDGPTLGELVSRRYPRIKILYTSGYTNDDILRYGLSTSEVEFLQKPFTPRRLVRKIRELLDQGLPKTPQLDESQIVTVDGSAFSDDAVGG